MTTAAVVLLASDFSNDVGTANTPYVKTVEEVQAELNIANALIVKHGICKDCGSLYEHEYDGPFANCDCHCSEWYEFTPHMVSQKRKRIGHDMQTTDIATMRFVVKRT